MIIAGGEIALDVIVVFSTEKIVFDAQTVKIGRPQGRKTCG